jgi:phospholipase/lecithinase/hemolysin
MTTYPLHRLALKALTLLMVASTPVYADVADNRFVVFGDSLSDAGNHYFFYGQVSEAPFAPIPDAPYDEHGHRFTNGPTWIEQLTREMHTPASGRPALVKPGVYTNYAVGRARARPNAPVFADFDLSTQIGLFLHDAHGRAPTEAMYVVWIGANDLDDAINALQTDPTGVTSAGIIHDALDAVASNIQALWAAGARSFFIPNLPNLGLTPALQALGPDAVAAGLELSTSYNAGLAQVLGQLQVLPKIKFTTLDVFRFLNAVAANPVAFGLKDAQSPCLTFFVVKHAICSHPDEHLFWDGVHPTAAGHEIVEEAAERALHAPKLAEHNRDEAQRAQ